MVEATGATGRGRALFLQCTEAGHYPPILNASTLMADAGWQVTVLSSPVGAEAGLHPGEHVGVRHLSTPPRKSNAIRPLDYLVYTIATLWIALRLRPKVVYASDPLSAGPALLAGKVGGALIIYHEHDSPRPDGLRPVIARWRLAVVRRARLVITPNCERGRLLRAETGLAPERLRTIWNLPRRFELPSPSIRSPGPLLLYYHGTITPDRVPEAVVQALHQLDGRVRLRLLGYEVPGARGYIDRLLDLGRRPRGASLVEYAGLAPRREVLALAADADVGLALMPMASDDVNMRHMAGASNKAFDYMAAGLALLVSDLDDWREMFVAPGFARACDPDDPVSIASALQWFVDHASECREMATRARAKIEADWNYDTAFAPILAALSETKARANA